MSTIKSSAEDLTLNADGSGNDIKFQSNGVEKASIDQDGKITAGGGLLTSPLTVKYDTSSGTAPTIILGATSNVSQDSYIQMGDPWTGSPVAVGLDNSSNTFKIARNSSGNLSSAEHIEIASDGTEVKISLGDIVFGTAGKGIVLGATSNTDANTLDDYEEGTWTVACDASGGGSFTVDTGANVAAYTKVGRVVHIQGGINIDGDNSANGFIRFTLPFTPFTGTKDTDYCQGNATLENHGGSIPNGINMFMYGDTHAYFRTIADNGSGSYIGHGDVDSAFSIKFSMTYIAA